MRHYETNDQVRLTYRPTGTFVGETFTVTGEDACHYFVEPSVSPGGFRVSKACVIPVSGDEYYDALNEGTKYASK